jgi:hypothetical protein
MMTGQKECESVRSNEVGAPVNRIEAEAVLTPRHKDLKIATWTRAAPLTTGIIPSAVVVKSGKFKGRLQININKKWTVHTVTWPIDQDHRALRH